MYNRIEFEVQMRRAGYNQRTLAKAMNTAPSTLSRKMVAGGFRRDEMALLIKLLKIDTPERFYEIFFA